VEQDRLDRVDDLFARARELPAGERAEFLLRECPDDEAARAETGRLLDQAIEGFLERPTAPAAALGIRARLAPPAVRPAR
jgi:hypothetical protein